VELGGVPAHFGESKDLSSQSWRTFKAQEAGEPAYMLHMTAPPWPLVSFEEPVAKLSFPV
jgi:hypothetical protein